jgi:hypothetical protein
MPVALAIAARAASNSSPSKRIMPPLTVDASTNGSSAASSSGDAEINLAIWGELCAPRHTVAMRSFFPFKIDHPLSVPSVIHVIISLLIGGIIPLLMPSYKNGLLLCKAFFSYYAKIMAGSVLPPAIWLRIM